MLSFALKALALIGNFKKTVQHKYSKINNIGE